MSIFFKKNREEVINLIKQISSYQNGIFNKVFLSVREKKLLIKTENDLYNWTLKNIYKYDYKIINFYLIYCSFTDVNSRIFKLISFSQQSDSVERDRCSYFVKLIYDNRFFLSKNRQFLKIAQESEDYFDKKIKQLCFRKKKNQSSWLLKRVRLISDWENYFNRIKSLFISKKIVLEAIDSNKNFKHSFLKQAKQEIFKMYLDKIDELIWAEEVSFAILREIKKEVFSLTKEENEVLNLFQKYFKQEKRKHLFYFWDLKKITKKEKCLMIEQLVSWELFFKKMVFNNRQKSNELLKTFLAPKEFLPLLSEILNHYQKKHFKKNEVLWKIKIDQKRKSMSVFFLKKTLFLTAFARSLHDIFFSLLSHEVEGHIFQNFNRLNVGLKIFQNGYAPGFALLSEAGAVLMERIFARKIFRRDINFQSFYLTVIIDIFKGCDYFECLQKIIYSTNLGVKGVTKEDRFLFASSRIKRLFKNAIHLQKLKGIVCLKDVAYSEAYLLLKDLARVNLGSICFVGGMNLYSIRFLVKYNFLDLFKIKVPCSYSIKLWKNYERDNSV